MWAPLYTIEFELHLCQAITMSQHSTFTDNPYMGITPSFHRFSSIFCTNITFDFFDIEMAEKACADSDTVTKLRTECFETIVRYVSIDWKMSYVERHCKTHACFSLSFMQSCCMNWQKVCCAEYFPTKHMLCVHNTRFRSHKNTRSTSAVKKKQMVHLSNAPSIQMRWTMGWQLSCLWDNTRSGCGRCLLPWLSVLWDGTTNRRRWSSSVIMCAWNWIYPKRDICLTKYCRRWKWWRTTRRIWNWCVFDGFALQYLSRIVCNLSLCYSMYSRWYSRAISSSSIHRRRTTPATPACTHVWYQTLTEMISCRHVEKPQDGSRVSSPKTR